MVSGIFYECRNKPTGCNYRADAGMNYLNCSVSKIKDEQKKAG